MILNERAIGLIGRRKNALSLEYNKSIIITTDILKFNTSNSPVPKIVLNDEENNMLIAANSILMNSNGNNSPQSIVYGENLVELLKWIIKTLMTHKHPPNASPIPDFFSEANNRLRTMEVDLLNRNIKSK